MAGFFNRSSRAAAPVYLDEATVAAALDLIGRDKPIAAIKLVRERTGLGLREAKETVDALAEGRPVQMAPAQGAGLADRVRELRRQDRPMDAIHLVAAETGMTESESARFIESLA